MTRRWKEADLQKAQIKYLETRRATVRDVMFCAIPNDAGMYATRGQQAYRTMGALRAIGLVPGAPDLIMWMRGRVIHIENKVKGRKPTNEQDAFGAGLKALGHEYHVITAETPGDAVDQLVLLIGGKASARRQGRAA